MGFRFIQATNNAIGAVAAGAILPVGAITHAYYCNGNNSQPTFTASSTGINTITIRDEGYYRITYSASLLAGAAGPVSVNLLQNNVPVYAVTQTSAAVGNSENLTLVFYVLVNRPCNASTTTSTPSTIQFQLATDSVAITGGTSNAIIEKVH